MRGDLKIVWADSKDKKQVASIDASNLWMLIRDGDPGFEVDRILEFNVDPAKPALDAPSIR